MARILAISSQVARGHVGLSAIVPALQALGHEVVALPTILLSNHPGHAHVEGERVSPDLLCRMLDALERNGWLGEVDAVLTGYLPSVEHVAFARDAVLRLRTTSPGILYLCDPVIGDHPKGVYIDENAAASIRDQLVPLAHALKLNSFELGWLAARHIQTVQSAENAVKALQSKLAVVTSIVEAPGTLTTALFEMSRERKAIQGKLLPGIPNGTGDLLSALWLGHLIKRDRSPEDAFMRACAGLNRVIEESRGRQELAIVSNLRGIRNLTFVPREAHK